jgi:hypothetical protein
MSRRLIVLVILTVSILTACGRASSTNHPAGGGYRIFLESGFSNNAETVKVVDSGAGTVERELPLGTPAPDWSSYYTVTQLSGSARLSAIDPASGRSLAQKTIPAGFALPSLGQGPTAGLSPNGEWLTLTDNGRATTGTLVTSFLVGASSLSGSFKTVHLDGVFSFDALSNDGNSLYLIQRMGDPNHYQVRLYDVAAGSLNPQVVSDKREPNEPMNGIRGDGVADPAGKNVYTVYIREAGPFIHALPLSGQPFAWCIDLPSKAPNDMETQFQWAVAVSPDGGSVYAANASLGTVAVMTTGQPPKIVHTASVAYNSPPPQGERQGGGVINADAKGPRIGGMSLSADGRTLYTLADHGLVAIDTATLKVRARYLESYQPETMRLSSDGKWLYAAESGNSKLWQIDPITGAVAEAKGVLNPWALLWAQPK